MKVKIGTEATTQFPEKEYINKIFVALEKYSDPVISGEFSKLFKITKRQYSETEGKLIFEENKPFCQMSYDTVLFNFQIRFFFLCAIVLNVRHELFK